MKSYEDPKSVIEHILKSFERSSTLHGGTELSFIDPLTGKEVKIDGTSKVTVENKRYQYPYEELKSSERGEQTLSEREIKPKEVVIDETKRKKPISPNLIDEAFSNTCCSCGEPIALLSNLSNINGKPAHKKCVRDFEAGRKKPQRCKHLTTQDSQPYCEWLQSLLANKSLCTVKCDGYEEAP